MSVGFPKHVIFAEVIASEQTLTIGSLSGQDSDKNVQGTGIAIRLSDTSYFLCSNALKNASIPSRNSAGT